MVIRHVGVWSVARLYGALSASMGLLFGGIIALFSLAGGAAGAFGQNADSVSGPLAMMFGVGAIVFLPVFYGILGLCAGALGAALYNLFAGMFGGIQLETEP
jgi:hypothetical protein